MEQYIKKSTLIGEIEKIRAKWFGVNNDFADGQKGALTDVLSLINTLELKEVDLEKEIDLAMPSKYCWSGDGEAVYSKEQMRNFAKHFFELGIKAQIMTSKLQQRISVLKMSFWTGLQTFEETEMTLSDAYNQGVDDILEELGLKAQKGEL